MARAYRKNDRSSPATAEPSYTDEERDFLRALTAYKQDNHRPFPTIGELLAILKALGYRRVAERSVMPRWPLRTDELMGG
mgnify:CR=1 FL=1